MTHHDKSHDASAHDETVRETTNEGEYTDTETESGRDTHKDDVHPGQYTDTDLGEGTD